MLDVDGSADEARQPGMMLSTQPPRNLATPSRHGGTARLRGVPVFAAALVCLALSGCVASTGTPPPVIPSSSSSPTPTASANAAVPHDDASVAPVPEAEVGSQAAAIAAAEKVVAVFGQPDLDAEAWMRNLYPLLSQTGAAAYEGTDPANVPVRQVTGPGVVLDGSTEVALLVEVPTDAGPYTVSLSRPSGTAPWLADRIRPAGN